ncbi:MAG: hypothetical protein KZQ64_10095 [gamma proteobacterium symbiont of Bathyaustriella thionipta]|nr:hypothetical protein [gamma proteobacterium symbiont of Bathyaustriella thionipta]MCU7950352.1 hypothetical protein [gamma proteobacterium symbiont of Bathyaustriella thionipta]MCU7953721.1 hypothetical protein [gamma proteobacterium symbiont of Bathyaustriella thionipta]MCU7957010.1 hypothetical protein [gamma proteobacterium symbiont of Bathyaustriella thionipta]MCU7967677.1 hypothetical protein [gamma proteobacterium symbiont of Bathyaustriella thionipta]
MNRTTLTLIVPGLIDPVPYLKELPAQDLPELPAFSTFLSRGRHLIPDIFDHSNTNFYRCLIDHLSIQTHCSQTPVASLSYLYDFKKISEEHDQTNLLCVEDLNDKWIMRVDPCFMMPDRDQLILAKTGNLGISLKEANQYVDEINHFFSQFDEDHFWTLKMMSADRWYLISDKPINIESVPPEKVLGQPVKSYLFSGKTEENRYWLNLFNEFQMILHQSHINKQRRENNKSPVNSVWFWGQDNCYDAVNNCAAKETSTAKLMLYSDNITMQALSVCGGGEYAYIPDNYQHLTTGVEQHVVYFIDDFYRAILNKDIFNWVGFLEQFEKNYLQPILDDINTGKMYQLELVSPTGMKLLVTKKLLRRWWRKNKKFYSFL